MDRERGSLRPTASHPRAGEPLGARPAPIGPRPARSTRPLPGGLLLAACLAVVVAASTMAVPARPVGADPAAPGHLTATGTGPSPPLALAFQTATVAPGENFDLRVQPGRGVPPTAELGVTVAVYGCLSSVSAFDQSVSSTSGPTGTRISATRSPIPLGTLPVAGGVYDLSMAVRAPDAAGPASPGAFTIDLTGGAQCGAYPSGVYPVRVELVDTANGQALGGFTTHLVYANPPASTTKLRVAVVLPVQTTQRASAAPNPSTLRARPQAALAPPPAAAVDAVTATVNLLATTHPSVPVTLDVSPQTVELLSTTGHQATVTQLATLAAAQTGAHQLAWAPYVPVDAAALVDAGLQVELGLQVALGTQVLATTVTRPPTTPGGPDTTPALGTWFGDAGMDAATLGQLQQAGYSQLVLPSADLSTTPTNGSTAEPFTLTTARGTTMTALADNSDLSARFPGSSSDPVLAAHQLVAELAQTYYEKPNDSTVRGVLAVPPSGWTDNPAFVDALLGALQSSPILQPVTTTALFGALGPGTACRTCRLSGATVGAGLPAGAIRTERQRINGFVIAAPASRATIGTGLSEVLLSGQSEDLRPAQQSAVVTNAAAAVNAQLDQLAVAGDRTVTLTSHTGRVPVTVVSTAPYPVRAELTVTSDKLLFAGNATSYTQLVVLRPNYTTVVPVSVQSRASGQFKVAIVLRVPGSGMVLASGQVSVRSTATSVVGIILSLGAVAVLAAWWIRTSRKRRRARRAAADASLEEEPAEPVVTG